jgi:hypothetical protein
VDRQTIRCLGRGRQQPVEPGEETAIELEFLLRLRGETERLSPGAPKAQILRIVAKAKRYFQLARRINLCAMHELNEGQSSNRLTS